MRLGLRGRFVAFVSAIIISFGVVLTALSVRVQSDRLRHELEERGKLLTTVVASHVVDPLALFDVRELRLLLHEIHVFLQLPGILYLLKYQLHLTRYHH